MNSIISKVLIAAVTVSADETIEHVNNVLFFSKIFFIGLDIIIFFRADLHTCKDCQTSKQSI